MPIGGTRNDKYNTVGNSYRKDKLYAYAKAFSETANMILKEEGYDLFEEPTRALHRRNIRETLKNFFVEESFDKSNATLDAEDIEDQEQMMEEQFNNDVEAMYEHAAPAEYSPIVGMALPIHKLILMNNVFDKGGIQKFTAVQPKFPVSLERRILVKPDGTEIDMFLQQNEIADAIDSTNPEKVIELALPVTEDLDIIATEFGGTSMDNLSISTHISAIEIKGVTIDVGDIKPNEEGFCWRDGEVATEKMENATVWFPVNIEFKPNYGGPNHFDRAVTYPLVATFKDSANGGAVTSKKIVITGSMNKNRFNIADLSGNIEKIRLTAKLDTSSAMLETCHTMWKIDTELVEIDNATPINTTISPEEVKDIAAMYNVNQLTKHMSMFKTVLSESKDMKIYRFLNDDYKRLDARNGFFDTFDFAPPSEYALTAVEYRSKMFMDFLDHFSSKMLQVLNDPNMVFTIYGDPLIVRKITPKDYSYTAPANIGPVTLDYTQTVCNMSDKRVYNFVGSDKMRNTNELIVMIKPHNSERIIYRIYDYQLYVSNEIRNITNPALPAIHAFERYKLLSYQPVQGRVKILNETGLRQE